jgi:hypothetical protein
MLNEARGPIIQQKAQIDQYYSLFFFLFFYAKVIPPVSYPTASKILITDITDFKFYTPQTTC